MPHSNTNKKNASGSGNIRKKTVKRNGKTYTYWEARVTVGTNPGTGKQIQKSYTGKTQKEVREKMQATTVAVNEHDYFEPTRMTLGEWLDIWISDFLVSAKPRTIEGYKANCKNHIKPALGAIRLSELTVIDVQRFYNNLRYVDSNKRLSPKTVKNIHGTLHKALEKAVRLGYIRSNPSDKPELPKIQKAEIKPLDDEQISRFLKAISGHEYEYVYIVTLFTGLRQGEVLGLTWDCIDFDKGTIVIKKQLQKVRGTKGEYVLASTKNGKTRSLTVASYVMAVLRAQRIKQIEDKFRIAGSWNNPLNLVFTNPLGQHLCPHTVYLKFKKIVNGIGLPDARFHDLRHSYAVAALRSGDDIKTVQENLGHYSAAFTLDTYAHVTDQMKQESANRMDQYIARVQNA